MNGTFRVSGTLHSYSKDSSENIIKGFQDYVSNLLDRIVPFAFDPAGNLMCFDNKNHEDNPILVFWEHENAAEKKC